MIKDQKEITGLTTIDNKQPTWSSTTLLYDKAFEITNAKTYVFADSMLWVGGISTEPVQAWETKRKWYLETRYLKELNRIDGVPMEFEWKNFPGFTALGILEEIQQFMTELQCECSVNLSSSKEGSSSCQCTTTSYGENEETQQSVKNCITVANYARKFSPGHWSFLGPESEKKWFEIYSDQGNGECDKTAEVCK